jgi:hypothetical protein
MKSTCASMALKLTRTTVALALLLTLGACYSISSYTGDGTLTRHHHQARYQLTLSNLDLSMAGTTTYRLRGLPEEEFVLGFEVRRLEEVPERIFEERPLHPVVSLRIRNEVGDLVIDEEAELSKWVWSGSLAEPNSSFIYRRGEYHEIPIGGGSVRLKRADERADAGWGSYFSPRSDGIYSLEIAVSTADARSAGYSVQIVGYGGQRFFF